jgi:hypothetical protein
MMKKRLKVELDTLSKSALFFFFFFCVIDEVG